MLSTLECLMQAENFDVAARLATGEERKRLMEQAVSWRLRAHELQMLRFERAKEIPDDPNQPSDPAGKFRAD